MPPSISPDTAFLVTDALDQGKSLRTACEEAGVSAGAFLRRVKGNQRVRVQYDETRLTAVAVVEDALFETAVKGNVTAQTLYLCNRAPERWRPPNATKVREEVLSEHVTAAELLERYRREDEAERAPCPWPPEPAELAAG